MYLSIKSIGIYGDSFTGYTSIPSIKYHWSNLLAQEFNCDLVNYGRGGSSIYFSYKKFLDNYSKHDCNIFLVSEPNRYISPVSLSDGSELCIPSLSALDYYSFVGDERLVNELRGWFIRSNDEFNADMAELMIEKILLLDDSTVVIPCFNTSVSDKLRIRLSLGSDSSLMLYQEYQAAAYNVNNNILIDNYIENTNVVSGHFVPEFNELLFRIIVNRIKTGQWDWIVPKNMKLRYKFDEVWTKRTK
jgi:hypothetical protein